MMAQFVGSTPEAAAGQVVAAIRAREWSTLAALLTANPRAVGRIDPWRKVDGPLPIVDIAEVQKIPELMIRYPGKLLVRYDIPDQPRVYKLEIAVEGFGGGYRVIDFWGLGW